MSTADLAAPPTPWSAPAPRQPAVTLPAAPDRGELSIAEQVVEKIAATALGEVDQIGGAARRVLGVPVGSAEADGSPQVSAQVNGSVVTVAARCSVAYPAPVGRVTDRARAHLIDRVEELTGLTAAQVDITVTALTAATSHHRRELR